MRNSGRREGQNGSRGEGREERRKRDTEVGKEESIREK